MGHQREQKFGLEVEKKEYDEIDKFCKDKIKWFASAWDVQSWNFRCYYLEYAKQHQPIVDINFLEEYQKKKYTFISMVCQHWKI